MAPAAVNPYHSKRGHSYHIYRVCNVGKRVKKRLSGKKGKLCSVCRQIKGGIRPR